MSSTEALGKLTRKVNEIQAIIDENDGKGFYSYVNEPCYQSLLAEEKALRKAYNQAWNGEYNSTAMEKTGLIPGDKVSYFSLSWTGLGADEWYGTVVVYRGQLKVKADEPIEGKRYFQVNRGWKKVSN